MERDGFSESRRAGRRDCVLDVGDVNMPVGPPLPPSAQQIAALTQEVATLKGERQRLHDALVAAQVRATRAEPYMRAVLKPIEVLLSLVPLCTILGALALTGWGLLQAIGWGRRHPAAAIVAIIAAGAVSRGAGLAWRWWRSRRRRGDVILPPERQGRTPRQT